MAFTRYTKVLKRVVPVSRRHFIFHEFIASGLEAIASCVLVYAFMSLAFPKTKSFEVPLMSLV